MTLTQVIDKLNLKVLAGSAGLDREVSGGYTSDLLSDVMANSKQGQVWITLQSHVNVVAVATLRELAAIILVGGRKAAPETLQKAEEEGLPILQTETPAFELSARLYGLLNG
ncbi:MAG: serine kinase [Deltaproteobacteria bacterium]|nr:serine kinase [Deltaproteobacteria bacterium]